MSNRRPKDFKKAHALILAAALCVSLAGCGGGAERTGPAGLLPDPAAVTGADGMGEVLEYEGTTLYDFLNGGAELYFDYGIVLVASTEYRTSGGEAIEVSVYDMQSPAGAFGIYSNIRYAGADFVSVGNEGMLSASSLDFWKGRYYCRLLTFDMGGDTQTVMLELGAALAANIAQGGSPPAVVGLLPEAGKIARSEKYFTGPLALNNLRYVSAENVFNLGENTHGAAAQYESDGTAYMLILIEYSKDEEARAGLDSFRAEVGEDEGALLAQSGRFVAGVWDLEGDAAREALGTLTAELEAQQ